MNADNQSCCPAKADTVTVLKGKISLYRPLIVITLISVLGGLALSMEGMMAMNGMMGLFLCFLASLKLFDIGGFVMTFKAYDLFAQRHDHYAHVYPFIELGLGLLFLSGVAPVAVNLVLALVMIAGIPGIVKAIRSTETIRCACVGTVFALPVGRVTLAENSTMTLMAIVNIFLTLTAP